MQRIFRIVTLVVATVLLSAVAVPAQQSSFLLFKADVPFEFSIQNHTYPAGQYFIQRISSNTLVLRDSDSKLLAAIATTPLQDIKLHLTPSLKFRMEGDRHVLAEVWQAGNNGGYELPHPKHFEATQDAMAQSKNSRSGGNATVGTSAR